MLVGYKDSWKGNILKKSTLPKTFAAVALVGFALLNSGSAFASTGGSDFNVAGELTSKYEVWSSSPTNFAQGTACGISDSGCIITDGAVPTLARQLSGVTFPAVGSSINTVVYFKDSDNNGYATLGFTGLTSLSNANTSGFPLNPTDAISLNAHGGGYVLKNAGNTVLDNGWESTTGVTNAHPFISLVDQGSGGWFKESITLTRVDTTNVNVTYKVEQVTNDGAPFGDGTHWAEFTAENVDASALISAGTVYPYFGNSDPRATNFDNAGDEIPAPVQASHTLASTGGNEYPMSVLAVSLISLGCAAFFAGRRKLNK
jgi:hypothetical protein